MIYLTISKGNSIISQHFHTETISGQSSKILLYMGRSTGKIFLFKFHKDELNKTQSLTSFSSRAPRSCNRLRAARVDSSTGGSGNCSSTSYNTDYFLEFQEFPGTISNKNKESSNNQSI